MRIVQEININDEPWVSKSTGVRKATLTYNGPKYLYLEYDGETNKVLCVTHISESDPDIENALEKLTPIEGREIIEINASERLIMACYYWNSHSVSVENYKELLENGETYEYVYSHEPQVSEIFDFNKMVWNKEKNDYNEYKFIETAITEEEMVESINIIIEKISNAIVSNDSLTDENKSELKNYLNQLDKFKKDMAMGVESWKMAFPICNIAY